jgi:hypothetical protein
MDQSGEREENQLFIMYKQKMDDTQQRREIKDDIYSI